MPRLRVAVLALAAALPCQESATAPWFTVAPIRPVLPGVRDATWVRQPIDRFVLARLEAAGLEPSPEADPATLLRRVHLDLTGLPPTRQELDAFLADASEGAYERVVDRLLASPQHGERMAQWWLDLARYSDTCGFDFDPDRQAWAYRDWVVQAFAADMPYDRFTREQVAGDLLPDATRAQRVATGFHRLHAVNAASDGQPGEYHHQYVADRTATFATTWLGLTVGCAECHDHKFDPISQRDYYGLYAFWNDLDEPGLPNPTDGRAAPYIELPTPEQATGLLELEREIDAARRALTAAERAREAARDAWFTARAAATHTGEAPLLAVGCDELGSAGGVLEGLGAATVVDGVRGAALGLDGRDVFLQFGQRGAMDADRPFTAAAWVRLEPRQPMGTHAVVGKLDEAEDGRGWLLSVDQDGLAAVALVAGDEQFLAMVSQRPIAFGRWHHVAFTYDGSRAASGLTLFVDGARVEAEAEGPEGEGEAKDEDAPPPPLVGSLRNDGNLRVGGVDGAPLRGRVDEVRLYERALSADELREQVLGDLAAMTSNERFELGHRLFTRLGDDELRALDDALADRERKRRELRAEVSTMSVLQRMATPRPTRLLARGDFLSPREVVPPAIPAVFGSLPEGAASDRRALADWLVRPDNPIVARVHVNRLWTWLFGQGLVATPGDFGSRGELPSHPALLDWLSREFVDGGFGHRAFVRMLVTSATYRQRSDWRPDLAEQDPDNRLLGRANRWRLDAEALRDQALLLAGRLDLRVGGPSVMPWQPEDLWPKPSKPEDRHRRGLYVAVKRSVPFVTAQLFDMPTRTVCTVQRDRTTTPLQALATFNDQNHMEAAQGLALRMLAADESDAARLALGFRWCTQRTPSDDECGVLAALLARLRARTADAAHGTEPATLFEAWSAAAAVLLNLDEVMVRS